MGLFGGFKAKFTKDSASKSESKSSKKNTVVCVGYRVYSEFDEPPQRLPQEPVVSKRPSAIKTVPPRPESSKNANETNPLAASTSAPIKTQIRTNPKAKKPANKKAPAAPQRTNAQESSNANKKELTNLKTESSKKSTDIELRNGQPKETRSAPNSVYVIGKTSSFNPLANVSSPTTTREDVKTKNPPKSILKAKSLVELKESSKQIADTNGKIFSDSDDDQDKSLTIAATKSEEKDGFKTETVNYLTATESVSNNYTAQVSTYVHAEVSSKSDIKSEENNTSSSHYSYNNNARSLGNTSSYAANIFFGGDEEPEVQRPRRMNISSSNENEDESRSSAEC